MDLYLIPLDEAAGPEPRDTYRPHIARGHLGAGHVASFRIGYRFARQASQCGKSVGWQLDAPKRGRPADVGQALERDRHRHGGWPGALCTASMSPSGRRDRAPARDCNAARRRPALADGCSRGGIGWLGGRRPCRLEQGDARSGAGRIVNPSRRTWFAPLSVCPLGGKPRPRWCRFGCRLLVSARQRPR
jgi:hypothetical protein